MVVCGTSAFLFPVRSRRPVYDVGGLFLDFEAIRDPRIDGVSRRWRGGIYYARSGSTPPYAINATT